MANACLNRQTNPQTRERPVEIDRSLLITHLGVVEDPMRIAAASAVAGAWTFRHLIEQMAGNQDPAEFTLRWLESWERDQTINGHSAPARPNIRPLVIDPWLQASGGQRLDLRKAPFKLLAIVSRIDLREHERREVKNAGEGRFIFGVLDQNGLPLPPVAGTVPGGFTVIFEYELPAKTMDALRHWAEDWSGLSRFAPGSKDYNATLEAMTRRFTDAGAAPDQPNGSALAQIRTNEVALNLPWELREFVIDAATGLPRPHTVAFTPDTYALNGTETLAALINANERPLLDATFELAPSWFGAASAAGPFQLAEFADADHRSFTINPLAGPFNNIPERRRHRRQQRAPRFCPQHLRWLPSGRDRHRFPACGFPGTAYPAKLPGESGRVVRLSDRHRSAGPRGRRHLP